MRPPVSVGRPLSCGLLPKQVTVGVRCIGCPEDTGCCGVHPHVSRRRSAPVGAASAFRSHLPLRGSGSGRGGGLQGFFSTDESVTFQRRFQLQNALSFHGLRSPPRSSFIRRVDERWQRTAGPHGWSSCLLASSTSLFRCGHPTSGSFRAETRGRLRSLSGWGVALLSPSSSCLIYERA